MLRVLFVTNSLEHGGAERHTVTLLNRITERGHSAHLAFVKDKTDQLARIRLRNGGTMHGLDARRYLDMQALKRFATTLSTLRPNVIVAANEYALLYATLAQRLAGTRASRVVTCHANEACGAKEQLKLIAHRPLFWTAACAVFVCEHQRRRWLKRGLWARRNTVIYNGVDTEEFADRASPGEKRLMREALGFTGFDFIIGITAGLRPEKNHIQLLEAIAKLRARNVPARAVLIGDGETRGAIEARARALDISEHIRITGFQSDIRPYLLACDAAVLCSLTEAFSLAAIEAMALGKPVVHSAVGGAAEMITPGWNGFLFPVNDTACLVEKLTLLADRTLCERLGRNARAVVARSFTENTMIERYEKLLLELSGRRAAQAPPTDGIVARGGDSMARRS